MTNANFEGSGRGRRTLRVTLQIDVQEEMVDEFLSLRVAEALNELLQWEEFRGGWGELIHEHDIILANGGVAAVRTEAVNWYGDKELI